MTVPAVLLLAVRANVVRQNRVAVKAERMPMAASVRGMLLQRGVPGSRHAR
ncbi:hypothetical protein ACRCUN_05335 [Mycobacterium sp. LTG2003]